MVTEVKELPPLHAGLRHNLIDGVRGPVENQPVSKRYTTGEVRGLRRSKYFKGNG